MGGLTPDVDKALEEYENPQVENVFGIFFYWIQDVQPIMDLRIISARHEEIK